MNTAALAREDGAMTATASAIAGQAQGYGLDRAFYLDAGIFERDMERIFRRHWLCAGHASTASNPGDYFLVEVEGESAIIVRGRDGELRALLNVCRHRGSEFCTEQTGCAEFFVCPYHAWTYGLDGSLLAARHMGKDFPLAAHGLKRLHLRVAEGLVFISFAETPLAFQHVADVLRKSCGAYGWADAKVAHRQSYDIAANWKLAVENYVECYHCAPAHPEYSKLHALEQPLPRIEKLNARMEERTAALGISVCSRTHWQPADSGEEAIDCSRYALYAGVKSGSEDGGPVAPLMGAFTEFDGGVTSLHVGGASFMIAYPDHGVIYRFVPRTLDSCRMELIWLVRGDAREGVDYERDRLTWLWRVTSDADKRIIEHTQRGVRSRFFRPGPLSPMEHKEQRFITWYLREIA
ncbi:MAG TPA: aromatic ring-hydroxylating dioxygenase subunit alpha [Acetobacteraceae bacterium]